MNAYRLAGAAALGLLCLNNADAALLRVNVNSYTGGASGGQISQPACPAPDRQFQQDFAGEFLFGKPLRYDIQYECVGLSMRSTRTASSFEFSIEPEPAGSSGVAGIGATGYVDFELIFDVVGRGASVRSSEGARFTQLYDLTAGTGDYVPFGSELIDGHKYRIVGVVERHTCMANCNHSGLERVTVSGGTFVVPEPATAGLFALALAAFAARAGHTRYRMTRALPGERNFTAASNSS